MNKKVTLACSVCASRNYTTNKNSSANENRLEVKKFCSRCQHHTLHQETK
ncbi:50S ribosomal protein L33 [Virgibacillus sp. W0430]